MTIAELIETLKKLPPGMEVWDVGDWGFSPSDLSMLGIAHERHYLYRREAEDNPGFPVLVITSGEYVGDITPLEDYLKGGTE